MKTLPEIKNEVADKYGCDDWGSLRIQLQDGGFRREHDLTLGLAYDEVAELYASQFREPSSPSIQSEPVEQMIVEQTASIKFLEEDNAKLRKLLHEHNGMCQMKLSKQLEDVLPTIQQLQSRNQELESENKQLRKDMNTLPEKTADEILSIAKLELAKKHGFEFWSDLIDNINLSGEVRREIGLTVYGAYNEAAKIAIEYASLRSEQDRKEIERLKEVARQDYRIVIEDEVDWYKDRIKELKSENELLKEAYKHFRKMRDYWHQEAIKYQNRSRELEEALRELISLDERTNVAGEIMSDSQGTVDCFPSPTEWRIAFDKAYKSLTKESAPSKVCGYTCDCTEASQCQFPTKKNL